MHNDYSEIARITVDTLKSFVFAFPLPDLNCSVFH
jgi:hypothetical protein